MDREKQQGLAEQYVEDMASALVVAQHADEDPDWSTPATRAAVESARTDLVEAVREALRVGLPAKEIRTIAGMSREEIDALRPAHG